MKPIIEFDHFSFKYRAQMEPTLQDISLKIYEGEKVLIVGPSGSGKSTLAHCINGLVPFSFSGDFTGEYRIKDKCPAELGIFELSKTVGTVLQDTDGQFVGLTVAEDIAFVLENQKVPQDVMKKQVLEVARQVRVEDLLANAPTELSGGQKQRVSMAGVMVDDVDILLFDEPLANLDPASGKSAIALIDEIHKQQEKTVIIIEHRLEDVLYRNVDRIVVIGEGRIVADTTPDELLSLDILEQQGIREPLYITALKHAGCDITVDMKPAHVDTIDFARCKNRVLEWYQQVPAVENKALENKILEIKGLHFAYEPGQRVLHNINADIYEGEMLSIVGKNGAGKSTLANLICGFYPQTKGEIVLRGEDITQFSIKERGERIGYVMQNPNQMISKTMIYDEVALGLLVRGVPEDEVKERVNQTLKICGLYPFRNWPISALSYGQKKRVTIASILVMNPEIIILDEPTAGQDYRHYTEIMEFLKHINEESGITIIMITHDMHLMLEYTNRAIVIADGQVLADDTPAKILTDEALSEKAYLKKTSLYDVAVACGIDRAESFVETFINYDRKVRENEKREVE